MAFQKASLQTGEQNKQIAHSFHPHCAHSCIFIGGCDVVSLVPAFFSAFQHRPFAPFLPSFWPKRLTSNAGSHFFRQPINNPTVISVPWQNYLAAVAFASLASHSDTLHPLLRRTLDLPPRAYHSLAAVHFAETSYSLDSERAPQHPDCNTTSTSCSWIGEGGGRLYRTQHQHHVEQIFPNQRPSSIVTTRYARIGRVYTIVIWPSNTAAAASSLAEGNH